MNALTTLHPGAAHPVARTSRLVILLTVVIVGTLFGPRPAAQPADEILVPPITSREFYRYARMMRLDHGQLIAAESAHEDYKESYRTLREREVAQFMRDMREFEDAGGMMPSRDTIEKVLRERQRVRARFKSLDLEFFNSLDPIMREDQRQRLDRVKKLREREYFQLGIEMQQAEQIELLDIVELLQLPAEIDANVDPLLISWENAYTAKMRDLEEKSIEGIMKMFDAMTAMASGMQFDENADPEEINRIQNSVFETMQKAMEPAQQIARESLALTRSAAAQIEASLPAPYAGSFKRMVQAQLYPSFFPDHSSLERLFDRALSVESLATKREAISQLRNSYMGEVESINNRLISLHDEHTAQNAGGPFGNAMNAEAQQTYWQSIQELQTKRNETSQRYTSELYSLVGEAGEAELVGYHGLSPEELRLSSQSDYWEGLISATNHHDEAGINETIIMSRPHSIDPYLPRAIDGTVLNGWLSRLGATPDQRDIITLLHQDYTSEYDERSRSEVQQILTPAQQAMNTPPVTDDAVKAIDAARARARDVLRAVDESFLQSMLAILSEAQARSFDQIRRSRERAVLRAAAFGWEHRGSSEPMDILHRLNLSADDWRAINSAIVEHDRSSIPLLTDRQRAIQQRDVVAFRGQRLYSAEEQRDVAAMQAYQQDWAAADAVVNAVDVKLNDLNERTTEAIAQALPGPAGERFSEQVRRTLYPEVYPDPIDAAPVLERALALRDLTDAQRTQIQSLITQHTAAHRALSDVLIEITKADRDMRYDNSARMMDEEAAASWAERITRQEQARYDRGELNATTLRRLRTILSAEQCSRIPQMVLK